MVDLFRTPSKEVSDFHNNDDVDSSHKAHHHTIGEGPNQVASGLLFARLSAKVEELEARIVVLEAGP